MAKTKSASTARKKALREIALCVGRNDYCGLPADNAIPCKSKYLGKTVPGKGGGKITGCATPSRASSRAHRETGARRDRQFTVGKSGRLVKGTTARKRILRAVAKAVKAGAKSQGTRGDVGSRGMK